MKVLVLSHYDDRVSSRPEAQLLLELSRRGVHIGVVTNRPSGHTREFEKEGIPVWYWHPSAKISPGGILRLRRLIREEGFDILHLFNSRSASNGVWASVGLPVKVVTYRGAGGLYWHDPLAYLSHLHPRVDRISCLSNYVKRQVDSQFIFRKKKTIVNYKAFLPEWFDGVRPTDLGGFGIPSGAIIVGCVANYRRVKGIETLIRASWHLHRNPDIHLLLIGRGMDNRVLQKHIARSPMKERIHVLGFREDVFELVSSCQVYVQPSVNEGLSKSVMEAMMLKVPCVVTRAGGMPELVADERSGIIVEKKDHQALAGAILRLAADDSLREDMGNRGRAGILSRFSMDAYADGVLSMYRELIG